VEDEIAAWLREQAEADIKTAGRSGETYFSESLPQWARDMLPGKAWAARDAQDKAARAESVLAVLGDYETTRRLAEAAWEQEAGAHSLYDQARALRRTVRKLAYGYRRREGWRPEWA
jgi:Family of unknown function (DUF6221)